MGAQRAIPCGSVALFIMMLPLIVRSTEETLSMLPGTLKAAGMALGGSYPRVIFKVLIPSAFGGIFTGILLAVSRVIGETAPLMFTALGCYSMQWDVSQPMSAVPLLIWQFFNDPNLQPLIWSASLFCCLRCCSTWAPSGGAQMEDKCNLKKTESNESTTNSKMNAWTNMSTMCPPASGRMQPTRNGASAPSLACCG